MDDQLAGICCRARHVYLPRKLMQLGIGTGLEARPQNKRTETRTEWHSNKLRPAYAAQRAKKSTGVHATLFRLPLPHRYAEAVLSEGGL